MHHLSPVDLTLVALYLAGITLFGLRFRSSAPASAAPSSRPGASLRTYFLADNAVPWWALSLSIVSAETSTLTIISIPGVAFAGNLGFLQVVLGYLTGRVVVALLFLPRYFRGEMLTAYQLIDARFGPTLHKLTAGLFLLTRAAAEGVRVFAISIVVGIAIGTGDVLSIAIISALTLLYTFEGGMAAVIWTDVVQMTLYVAGTLVALWSLGHLTPGGWSHIHAAAAPLGKFHLFDFTFSLTRAYTFWAGLLGGTFLTMASHGTDQLMVQRMLAARNLRESRLALLSSGVIILLQFTLFLLIGTGLFVFYGGQASQFHTNDHIFPTFIVQNMPHGVAGLLVAAILAAAMSNLSAALNSLASTSVVDFYVPWRTRLNRTRPSGSPEAPYLPSSEPNKQPGAPFIASSAMSGSTDVNTTRISRLFTVLWAVILFLIAVYSIQAGGKGHVVETGLSIASVAYGCLLGVFLLGTLTRASSKYGATQPGAILGMLIGFLLNLYLWRATHVAFTWYVLIGAAATFLTGLLFSLILPRPRTTALLLLPLLCLSFRSEAQESASPSASSAHPPRSASTQPDFTPASTLINDAIATGKLPGAVLLVGHDNGIVFEHAYGLRKLPGEPGPNGNPSPAEPMTTDTIFDMASLTKVIVTTTAILQLYEQHKLDLEAPVAQYLPDFAANGKNKITVRELLTHYSGLPEDVDLKDPWGLAAPDKAEGIRRAMSSVPYGPPGLTFKYSDINFITLGALVEKLDGHTLDDYALQNIFDPLAMAHTAFHSFAKACGPHEVSGAAIEVHLEGLYAISCPPEIWNTGSVPHTAPTAHDNEGTAGTNPNFDHLLRGTVHDPTTRRMGGVAGHAGLFSTAADMSRFCDALLAKLLHNTGPFPLKQSTLQLATSPQEPPSASNKATIFTPDGKPSTGVASRGLGWDLNSPFSRPRGELFPISTREHPGSFGHTGFTGTSLWLDPTSNTYVILLANAIHPRGNPTISPLRGAVATAVARALDLGSDPSASSAQPPRPRRSALPSDPATGTLTGIDVLEATHFAALTDLATKLGHPLRLGLVANQASLDRAGRRTIDVLASASGDLKVTTIFAPEHGLSATQDTEHLGSQTDPGTHTPVISVYGPKPSDKHPKASDLRSLDAVLIDLPDAGVRFWTFETLTGYFLEACAKSHIPLIILDRPNPIGGLAIQGPTSAPGTESYNNFMPLPLRHGLTLGELARFFNAQAKQVDLDPTLTGKDTVVIGTPTAATTPPATQPGLHAPLTVISLKNWERSEFFADTGLTWTPPSPNLRSPAAAILYPGVGLVEQTNISVGRGTPDPFENLGASWLNASELATYLTERHIPGISVSSSSLTIAETPEHYPFHGQTIPAIHFTVTDRNLFDSPEFGAELLGALHHLYPSRFQLDRVRTLLADPATLEKIRRGEDPRAVAESWQDGIRQFEGARQPYLLYH